MCRGGQHLWEGCSQCPQRKLASDTAPAPQAQLFPSLARLRGEATGGMGGPLSLPAPVGISLSGTPLPPDLPSCLSPSPFTGSFYPAADGPDSISVKLPFPPVNDSPPAGMMWSFLSQSGACLPRLDCSQLWLKETELASDPWATGL